MYTAIMHYQFHPHHLEAGVKLWLDQVADTIVQQPGFISVQFFHEPSGKAIAIGQWEGQAYAEAYMATGVFAQLLKGYEGMLLEPPRGGTYTPALQKGQY